MLLLQNAAAIVHAAETHPDAGLRALLTSRIAQLSSAGIDIGEQVNFFIVQPGDTLNDVTTCMGVSPLENLVDGARFPEEGFVPAWEWEESHSGGWIELAFILSDDGPAHVLLVQDTGPPPHSERQTIARVAGLLSARSP